jgi:glycosyltransferase involved in cell wall biosynthesis
LQLSGTPPRIVFCGNLHYRPNVIGILDFIASNWQTVKRRLPEATLHIVGSRPKAAILKLAQRPDVFIYPNVVDPRCIVDGCDISIAPIPVCGGFPNKVVDALANSCLPVIARPETIRGLVEPLAAQVLTAAIPEQWADQIARLCHNNGFRQCYVERLSRLVAASYDTSRIRQSLERVYENSIRRVRDVS